MTVLGLFLRVIVAGGLGAAAAIASARSDVPPGNPLIRTYPVSEYQGNLQNWAIAQGRDGLMYVGGGSSLLVFDGANWRNIPTRHDGRVRDVKSDDQGRIWVASPGEFGYFERDAAGTLQYVSIADLLPETEREFGETRHLWLLDDAVYFNTFQRLYRYEDGKLTWFDQWDGTIRMTFVAHGRYYAVVGSRIFDLTEFPNSGEQPTPEDRWLWDEGTRITTLLEWEDDRLLMGTYDDGLYLLSEAEPERFAPDAGLESRWPYKALRLRDGSVLVTTIHGGAVHLSADGELLEHFDKRLGLSANATLGAAEDHQGGLWLAQEGAIARIEFASSIRRYGEANGISNVRQMTEYQGELLLADGAGISALRTSDQGTARAVPIEAGPIQEAFDVHATPTGVLVSGFHGVHLMDIDLVELRGIGITRVFADTYAYRMFPSIDGQTVYVEGEAGLGVLKKTAQGWEALPPIEEIRVRPATVAEDGQGTVWVGSDIGAYYRLRWTDAGALKYVDTLDASAGVPEGNAFVYRLGERLIFGTTRGGYRLAADGDHLEPDPLFGNAELSEDRDVFRFFSPDDRRILAVLGGHSELWVGERGADGAIHWAGRALRLLDLGVMSFVEQQRGQVWFGRAPYLYRMDWPRVVVPEEPSPLHIRRAAFPDRESDAPLMDGIVIPGAPAPAPLDYSRDTLRFDYALAAFQRPEQTRYRTRLVGLDDDWSRWTSETRRDVTNLAGGRYELQVQAKDVMGQVFAARPFRFRVLPPWYFSPAAWAVYAFATVALLALAAVWGQRMRQRQMQGTQDRLEARVAERTREVRRQARELRELNEAQSRFFANVSHEFRTPLTLAKAPLEELVRGTAGEMNDEARQLVSLALRNTQTMQGLIGQILDVKRLEAGEMPVSVAHDDFAACVTRNVETFRWRAQNDGVELDWVAPETPLMADFDRDHMDKVIRNLLSNAFKFTPRGGSVKVRLDADADHVVLRVQDTGVGMSDADRQRAFDRYFQGDQTHASAPGTGIGLSLVKDLVALHEGEVAVESQPGLGSTFTVRFPAELPELRAQTATRGEVDGVAWPRPTSPADDENVPTVLIVDDNDELRGFLHLRLAGSYRILEAVNGKQGLELARESLPDIVVTDVMMPEMTGLQMTERLKSDPDTEFIPVLMLSARTTRRDTVAGLERGADDYLSKPFDAAELAARVAGLIASRRKILGRRVRTIEAENPSPFMARVHAILGEHMADGEFGAQAWAELMHMDRTTLYRKLKAETNQSPEEYLRERRLVAAEQMLRAGEGNVSQVAVAVGFNSISYFSRRFKDRFGVSPARMKAG